MAENPSTSSFILFPSSNVLIRIVPNQIGNESTVRYIGGFWNTFNLIEAMHVFGNTSMHAHNFFIDQCNQRHVVKALIKCLPESNFVAPLDFVEETVDSCDALAFVVTS